jgi:hypothetical protein
MCYNSAMAFGRPSTYDATKQPAGVAAYVAFCKQQNYTAEQYGAQLAEISDKALRQRLKDGNWDYDEERGALMRFDNIHA